MKRSPEGWNVSFRASTAHARLMFEEETRLRLTALRAMHTTPTPRRDRMLPAGYLTLAQAAPRVHRDASTVGKHARKGRFPSRLVLHMGRRVRIVERDGLMAWHRASRG